MEKWVFIDSKYFYRFFLSRNILKARMTVAFLFGSIAAELVGCRWLEGLSQPTNKKEEIKKTKQEIVPLQFSILNFWGLSDRKRKKDWDAFFVLVSHLLARLHRDDDGFGFFWFEMLKPKWRSANWCLRMSISRFWSRWWLTLILTLSGSLSSVHTRTHAPTHPRTHASTHPHTHTHAHKRSLFHSLLPKLLFSSNIIFMYREYTISLSH